jgi:hypothetical protein
MKGRLLSLLCLVAVGLVLLLHLLPAIGPEQDEPLLPLGAAPEHSGDPADRVLRDDGAAREGDGTSREEVAAGPAADPVLRRGSESSLHLSGQVLDLTGEPLASVPIATAGAPRRALAESDAAGRFELAIDETDGVRTLIVFEGAFVAVRNCVVSPESRGRDAILVAAPAIELAGLVVDEAIAPLEGARVSISIPDDLFRDFPHPLDRARRVDRHVETGENGRFQITSVPAVGGAQIVVNHAGFEATRIPLPGESREDLVLEMHPSSAPLGIEGRVLRPDLSPAPAAHVHLGPHETRTDENGNFTLPLPDPSLTELTALTELTLAAGQVGFRSALLPHFRELLDAWAPYPPPPPTLVLGEEPLEITGKVVDAHGEGQARWKIFLHDGTVVGEGQMPPVTAESLAAGGARVITGADGSFQIGGLLDREYVLRALDFGTMLGLTTAPIRAGRKDVRIEIPADALHERLVGRVVSRGGEPIPGVHLLASTVLHADRGNSSSMSIEAAITDETGAFALEGFPRRGVSLRATGDHIIPETVKLEQLEGEQLEISVARRHHFRVVGAAEDPRTIWIEFLDARGESVPTHSFEAASSRSWAQLPVSEGRSAIYSVSEDAVLLRASIREEDGESVELLRQGVSFEAEGITEIELDLP